MPISTGFESMIDVHDGDRGLPGTPSMVPGPPGLFERRIFRRSASAPATPTGGSYNSETAVLTAPSGWSTTPPSGATSLYISFATVDPGNSYSLSAWSTPFEATGDQGQPGPSGTLSATTTVYYAIQQSATPSRPSAISYNFTTGAFAGLSTGWTTQPITLDAAQTTRGFISTVHITEATRGGAQTLTFGTPTALVNFDGLIRFSNGAFNISGNAITTIDGSNITTGNISNGTGAPATAGAVPGSGQVGANIDLTNGNFTFGSESQFIRFNSTDGLVQGGVQTFTAQPRIYRGVASGAAITNPGTASGFFNDVGSFNFTAPTGWSRTIPSDSSLDVYESVGFVSGRANGVAATVTWGAPQLFRLGIEDPRWSLSQTGSVMFSYSSSSDFTPSPGSRTVQITAREPGSTRTETVNIRLAVNLGSLSNLNASRFSVTEFGDSSSSFTVASETFNRIAPDLINYTVRVNHDSGSSISIVYMLVGQF